MAGGFSSCDQNEGSTRSNNAGRSALSIGSVMCLETVPEKREAMEAYLILSRSKAMLKEELQSFVSFHKAKKNSLLEACTEVKSLTYILYNRGILALLYRLLQEIMNLLQGAQYIFIPLMKTMRMIFIGMTVTWMTIVIMMTIAQCDVVIHYQLFHSKHCITLYVGYMFNLCMQFLI